MAFRPALALAVALVPAALGTACRSTDRYFGGSEQGPASEVKFDSATSIALDGTIPDGVLYSKSPYKETWLAEITDQLYYTVGQLNGRDGVGDMARLEISIDETNVTQNGPYKVVPYAAKMFIAWAKESWPTDPGYTRAYTLYMPRGGDFESRLAFFNEYKDKCMAEGAHDVQVTIFWYYYRPQAAACPMRNGTFDRNFSAKLTLNLAKSDLNTEGKAPEYHKVWEDHKLVVTAIFGQSEPSDSWPTEQDSGASAFNETYRQLRALSYGTFKSVQPASLGENDKPSLTTRDVWLKFDVPNRGEMDVRLLLVQDPKSMPAALQNIYNDRTRTSDLVTYSGHSGLGANIRALASMGHFMQNQWQLFLVNGCDTFAYVDNALRDAHATVNPGYGPSKFFDIVTNAMPSYFSMNPRSNMALINALAEGTKTYREILANFDPSQRAVVTGEEDNKWPAAFLDAAE